MPMCRQLFLLSLLLLALGPSWAARPGAWRCDRIPGSSQLALPALEWIVLPDNAGEPLRDAATDLQALLAERLGAQVEIASRGGRPKHAIFLELKLGRRGEETGGAFSIRRDGTRLWVRAADEAGLINGLYTFCSEVLGARWYWDGPLGFEWHGEPPRRYGELLWNEKPVFVHRQLYPFKTDYGSRNRLNRVYRFNHNLAKVFTAERFTEEPAAFAEIRGLQKVPLENGARDPQPDFTSRQAVEIAAKAVITHFEQSPESPSFSLSINDNVLFDDTEATQDAVSPLSYFRRRPDYTDLVFGFMNEVAVKVFDEAGMWETSAGEPRYLTALAYYWTEQSPSIELHPRVMPVLTSDRAQWHWPEYREEDRALIDRWAASGAERVATWDYYFGAPLPYPRQFTQWIDESLKYLDRSGVDVFFSQLPAWWGMDGPKPWLATQLLWDPSQNTDKLIDEYYTDFFGAAAQPMRRFYERAESHRNMNEGAAEWIKFYKDEAGIELFDTEILAAMRSDISEAELKLSDDSKRLSRVEIVSDAFKFSELYATFHLARVKLVDYLLTASKHADLDLPRMESLKVHYQTSRIAYLEWGEGLRKQEMHKRIRSFLKVRQSDPLSMVGAIESLAEGVELSDARPVFDNVDLRSGPLPPAPRDFLGPDLPDVNGWNFDFRASEWLKVEPVGAKRLNERGLRISGADIFSVFRDGRVAGGGSYYLDAECAWQVSPDNRTQIRVNWYNQSGELIRSDLPLQLPWGKSDSSKRILLKFDAPEEATRVRVHFTISRQYSGDFLELTRIDLREVLDK